MKQYIIGTIIVCSVAVITPILIILGVEKLVATGILVCIATIGFVIQMKVMFSEKKKLDELSSRFKTDRLLERMIK
ncbi:MAG: hypothetical protein HYW78_01930 [Parcubacteria group bacterium]|nr:hypothetical protein [Parcubacteria group bacterium]